MYILIFKQYIQQNNKKYIITNLMVKCILSVFFLKNQHQIILTCLYIPRQKYKTTLKNEEKDIVYNF